MKSIKELLEFYWDARDTWRDKRFKVDNDHSNARRVVIALRGLNINDYTDYTTSDYREIWDCWRRNHEVY